MTWHRSLRSPNMRASPNLTHDRSAKAWIQTDLRRVPELAAGERFRGVSCPAPRHRGGLHHRLCCVELCGISGHADLGSGFHRAAFLGCHIDLFQAIPHQRLPQYSGERIHPPNLLLVCSSQ